MKKLNQEQLNRMNAVNSFFEFVVLLDKERHNPFLGHKQKDGSLIFSLFLENDEGNLCYIDPYLCTFIDVENNIEELYDKCSEGGLGQELIRQLSLFILKNEQGYLNDYAHTWAWDFKKIEKIREKAFSIGFIETVYYPYTL